MWKLARCWRWQPSRCNLSCANASGMSNCSPSSGTLSFFSNFLTTPLSSPSHLPFSFPLHLSPQVIWFSRKTLGFMLSSAEKSCGFMVELCLLNIVSLQIRIWVLSNLTKGKSEFGYFTVQRKGSRVSPC
jgi:hypothetical protein